MQKLPEKFADLSLTALPEAERAEVLRAIAEGEAARGLRLRPGVSVETVREALPGAYEPISWADGAYHVGAEVRAGAHPLHAAGAYYLQEPSAMAAVPALCVRPGMRVLDLCAAPGGKSTQIAAALAGTGALVANEIVPSRARVLSQNIERLGVPNAAVTNEPPEKLARLWGAWFDRVLVDAPCSGEGMFRRDPAARAEWSPATPAGCAERQRAILRSAAALLRAGGTLVYSTCTFNEIENEGVIEGFVREMPMFSVARMERLWPHKVRGEGHFVARLQKGGAAGAALSEETAGEIQLDSLLPGFFGAVSGALYWAGDRAWARPAGLPPLDGIRALRTGLSLCERRGKIALPDHALSMATPPGTVCPSFPVDDAGAARYLRGETLDADGAQNGWVAVAYRGLSLGFGKCVGGVVKNHLPKGLRVMA